MIADSTAGHPAPAHHEPQSIDLRLRLAVNLLMIVVMSWLLRHWLLDDSLIYARYFRHALEGRGLVFNDGEYVNAMTSPIYAWIVLGVCSLLHGHILGVQAILSALFLLLATSFAELTVPFSGIALAAGSYLYLCKGMETSLFLLVLLLTVLAYKTRRTDWLPLLCLSCVLTRFEGGAMLAVVAWRCWQESLRPRLRAYIAPALVLACYCVFNVHYYHRLLPQSAAAKIGQGMSGFWGSWPNAFLTLSAPLATEIGSGFASLVALAVIAAVTSRNPVLERWNRVVLPFLALLGAFYVFANIPNYHWYYAPFLFFLTIAVVQALPRTRAVQYGFLLVLLFFLRDSAYTLHHRDGERPAYDDAALWLCGHSQPNARVAAVETGHIGWFCDRYLIDMVGLTTPRNGTYTAHRDFNSWFNARPEFIVVHPSVNFPWEKAALASPDYEMLPVSFDDVRLLRRKDVPILMNSNSSSPHP